MDEIIQKIKNFEPQYDLPGGGRALIPFIKSSTPPNLFYDFTGTLHGNQAIAVIDYATKTTHTSSHYFEQLAIATAPVVIALALFNVQPGHAHMNALIFYPNSNICERFEPRGTAIYDYDDRAIIRLIKTRLLPATYTLSYNFMGKYGPQARLRLPMCVHFCALYVYLRLNMSDETAASVVEFINRNFISKEAIGKFGAFMCATLSDVNKK